MYHRDLRILLIQDNTATTVFAVQQLNTPGYGFVSKMRKRYNESQSRPLKLLVKKGHWMVSIQGQRNYNNSVSQYGRINVT